MSLPSATISFPSTSISKFQDCLKSSKRILALLGAGLSASSGLATFRGVGSDGLWHKNDPAKLATRQAFVENPELVWGFYQERRRQAFEADPNKAHLALARLADAMGPEGFVALSMNIDALSARAGHPSPQLLELHGNLFDLKCFNLDCDYVERDNFDKNLIPDTAESGPPSEISNTPLPKCPKCRNLLRPDIVWFGENMSREVVAAADSCIAESEHIDLILVIGTTAQHFTMAAGTYKDVRGQTLRRFIPDIYPPGAMDKSTKQKLEGLRSHVRRYPFRVWSNSPSYPSGGDVNLNTVDTITPLAFHTGRGHDNVYDLSRRQFAKIVVGHVDGEIEDFYTEFSSWTASLAFALICGCDEMGVDRDHIYISMIDTRALWDQNPIFFVPELGFLNSGLEDEHAEYLVHGVVQGPFLCAISIALFERYGFCVHQGPGFDNGFTSEGIPANVVHNGVISEEITETTIENAALLARHAAPTLMFPMMLASLGTQIVPQGLFDSQGLALKFVLCQLPQGLIRTDWINDSTVMHDVVFTGNESIEPYPDVRQLNHLMRATAVRQARDFQNNYSTLTNPSALNIRDAHKRNAAVKFNDIVEMMTVRREYRSGDSSNQVGPGHKWEEHTATGTFDMSKISVNDRLDEMGLEAVPLDEVERRWQESGEEEPNQQQSASTKRASRKRKVDLDAMDTALDQMQMSGRSKRSRR